MTQGKLTVVKIMYFANFTEKYDCLDTVLDVFPGTWKGLYAWAVLRLSFH